MIVRWQLQGANGSSDRRWPPMEDNFWWKTTFNWRHILMEDFLCWKTSFGLRWSLMENIFLWTTTLLTKLIPGENCHGWSPEIPRRVTHQPKDSHPPEERVLLLRIWHLHFTYKTNTRWQLPRMVTYHPYIGPHPPKDGHPPEESVLKTRNFALRLNSQN